MTHSLKINKPIQYASMIILVLALMVTSVAIASPVQAERMTGQENTASSDEQKIKATIDAYFTTRYEGQKTLDEKDYSSLVSTKNGAQAWLNKAKDKQEIEIFQGKTFGLNYLSYKYTLDYQSVKIVGNTANVTLFENNEVVYAVSAPTVTKLANLKHVLSLELESNNWKITSDNYRDELTQLMENKSKLEIKQDIQKEHDAKLKSSHTPKAGLARTFLPAYNRTNAVNYAHAWWSYPGNSNDYRPFYFSLGAGGDCTNYASQVIKAGGGKLDSSGTKKWFYSEGAVADNFNVWSTYSDDTWSNSWTVVGNLHTYLMDNTADTPGPAGLVWPLASLCSMSGGDLIQLSSDGGSSYFHVVVVVGVGTGCTADGHNVYINSHDTDRQNYPVIAYTGYTKRLVKISQP